MEAYNSSNCSSNSSSSSSSLYFSSPPQYSNNRPPKGLKEYSSSYRSSLHYVRKQQPFKPWKKPIAPLPPTPPKVYKVDPINFRDLVQRLTGAPEPPQPRLQNFAPPPLDLAGPLDLFSLPDQKTTFSTLYQELLSETKEQKAGNTFGSSSLELNLSPTNWCSFPLLSPGTLSSLEQSTVL